MKDFAFTNKEELECYVGALINLAKADNDFAPAEKDFIEKVIKAYCIFTPNINFIEVMSSIKDIDLCVTIETLKQDSKKAKNLLHDLIVLGHIDGMYSDVERKTVAQYANMLNIAAEDVNRLEKAVSMQFEAEKEIEAIICVTKK